MATKYEKGKWREAGLLLSAVDSKKRHNKLAQIERAALAVLRTGGPRRTASAKDKKVAKAAVKLMTLCTSFQPREGAAGSLSIVAEHWQREAAFHHDKLLSPIECWYLALQVRHIVHHLGGRNDAWKDCLHDFVDAGLTFTQIGRLVGHHRNTVQRAYERLTKPKKRTPRKKTKKN